MGFGIWWKDSNKWNDIHFFFISWPESSESLLIWPIDAQGFKEIIFSANTHFHCVNPLECSNITSIVLVVLLHSTLTELFYYSFTHHSLVLISSNFVVEHLMRLLGNRPRHHIFVVIIRMQLLSAHINNNDNHFMLINKSHWATSFTTSYNKS